MRRRLTELRYLAGDARYAIGRAPRWAARRARDMGGWIGERWKALDVHARRRLTATAGTLAGLAFVWLVLIPVAPCGFPGGDRCPPGDDAEELVPAKALAYLHVNLDPDTEQAGMAGDLAAKLPTLAAEFRRQLSAVPGLGLDLGEWFEGEVATAFLPSGAGQDTARTVVMLEVTDERGARGFSRDLLGPGRESAEHRGVTVETAGSQSAALVGGFLVVGESSAVRRIIDTAEDEAPSIAGDEIAARIRNRLPDGRLGDAYVSRAGARQLLRPGAGTLSIFEPFVNPDAAVAAAGALVMTDEGAELELVSDLDADLIERSPGFFGAFEPFGPELPGRLSAETLAYLGLGRPAEGARELIAGAAESAPGLAAGIEGLARDLQRDGQISLVDQVLPLLGEEAAISVGPPGRPTGGAVPYLALLTRGIDEERAKRDMARLQGPIAAAVGARGSGSFEALEVDGTEALTLRASPTVSLTYAVFDDTLVLATQPEAVEAARDGDSLDGTDLFGDAMSNLGGSPVALLFADLGALVKLGEQAGLAEDPAYAIFAGDLRRLRGLGILVGRDGDHLASTLRLLVD